MNARFLFACLVAGLLAIMMTGCQSNADIPTSTAPFPQPALHRTLLQTWTPTPSATLRPSATISPTATLTPTVTPSAGPGEPFTIGFSVQGRPLTVYRFGEGLSRRMITAGIHGGYESNTSALAEELLQDLQANPQLVPEGVTLYVLPLLNPDGYAADIGPGGRANAHGVDLNRNWDANWQAEWPTAGCWSQAPISAGEQAFSEPETQALRDFILTHPLDALISYHSAKPGLFAGGIPPGSGSRGLAKVLARASGYPYPVSYGVCVLTGQLVDWAAAQGTAAVDIELSYHGTTDLGTNRKILQALLEWNRK